MVLRKRAKQPEIGAPGPDEIRDQLAAMVRSHRFRHAGAERILLQYLVERALQGDHVSLDEKAIAVAVFGRPESAPYDPLLDPVVRIIGARLRKRLQQYYAHRPNKSVRITLSRNSFVPAFSRRKHRSRRRRLIFGSAAVAALVLAAVALFLAFRPTQPIAKTYYSLAVLPFTNLNIQAEVDKFVDSETQNLIARISSYKPLRLVRSPADYESQPKNPVDVAKRLHVDALLEGAVYLHGPYVRIILVIIDGATGKQIWTDVYESPQTQLPSMETDIGYAVAHALGLASR